jgi:hypothetical protein
MIHSLYLIQRFARVVFAKTQLKKLKALHKVKMIQDSSATVIQARMKRFIQVRRYAIMKEKLKRNADLESRLEDLQIQAALEAKGFETKVLEAQAIIEAKAMELEEERHRSQALARMLEEKAQSPSSAASLSIEEDLAWDSRLDQAMEEIARLNSELEIQRGQNEVLELEMIECGAGCRALAASEHAAHEALAAEKQKNFELQVHLDEASASLKDMEQKRRIQLRMLKASNKELKKRVRELADLLRESVGVIAASEESQREIASQLDEEVERNRLLQLHLDEALVQISDLANESSLNSSFKGQIGQSDISCVQREPEMSFETDGHASEPYRGDHEQDISTVLSENLQVSPAKSKKRTVSRTMRESLHEDSIEEKVKSVSSKDIYANLLTIQSVADTVEINDMSDPDHLIAIQKTDDDMTLLEPSEDTEGIRTNPEELIFEESDESDESDEEPVKDDDEMLILTEKSNDTKNDRKIGEVHDDMNNVNNEYNLILTELREQIRNLQNEQTHVEEKLTMAIHDTESKILRIEEAFTTAIHKSELKRIQAEQELSEVFEELVRLTNSRDELLVQMKADRATIDEQEIYLQAASAAIDQLQARETELLEIAKEDSTKLQEQEYYLQEAVALIARHQAKRRSFAEETLESSFQSENIFLKDQLSSMEQLISELQIRERELASQVAMGLTEITNLKRTLSLQQTDIPIQNKTSDHSSNTSLDTTVSPIKTTAPKLVVPKQPPVHVVIDEEDGKLRIMITKAKKRVMVGEYNV